MQLLAHKQAALPCMQSDVAAELAALQPALAAQLVALPLERFQERERGVQVGRDKLPGRQQMTCSRFARSPCVRRHVRHACRAQQQHASLLPQPGRAPHTIRARCLLSLLHHRLRCGC